MQTRNPDIFPDPQPSHPTSFVQDWVHAYSPPSVATRSSIRSDRTQPTCGVHALLDGRPLCAQKLTMAACYLAATVLYLCGQTLPSDCTAPALTLVACVAGMLLVARAEADASPLISPLHWVCADHLCLAASLGMDAMGPLANAFGWRDAVDALWHHLLLDFGLAFAFVTIVRVHDRAGFHRSLLTHTGNALGTLVPFACTLGARTLLQLAGVPPTAFVAQYLPTVCALAAHWLVPRSTLVADEKEEFASACFAQDACAVFRRQFCTACCLTVHVLSPDNSPRHAAIALAGLVLLWVAMCEEHWMAVSFVARTDQLETPAWTLAPLRLLARALDHGASMANACAHARVGRPLSDHRTTDVLLGGGPSLRTLALQDVAVYKEAPPKRIHTDINPPNAADSDSISVYAAARTHIPEVRDEARQIVNDAHAPHADARSPHAVLYAVYAYAHWGVLCTGMLVNGALCVGLFVLMFYGRSHAFWIALSSTACRVCTTNTLARNLLADAGAHLVPALRSLLDAAQANDRFHLAAAQAHECTAWTFYPVCRSSFCSVDTPTCVTIMQTAVVFAPQLAGVDWSRVCANASHVDYLCDRCAECERARASVNSTWQNVSEATTQAERAFETLRDGLMSKEERARQPPRNEPKPEPEPTPPKSSYLPQSVYILFQTVWVMGGGGGSTGVCGSAANADANASSYNETHAQFQLPSSDNRADFSVATVLARGGSTAREGVQTALMRGNEVARQGELLFDINGTSSLLTLLGDDVVRRLRWTVAGARHEQAVAVVHLNREAGLTVVSNLRVADKLLKGFIPLWDGSTPQHLTKGLMDSLEVALVAHQWRQALTSPVFPQYAPMDNAVDHPLPRVNASTDTPDEPHYDRIATDTERNFTVELIENLTRSSTVVDLSDAAKFTDVVMGLIFDGARNATRVWYAAVFMEEKH